MGYHNEDGVFRREKTGSCSIPRNETGSSILDVLDEHVLAHFETTVLPFSDPESIFSTRKGMHEK